MSTGLKKTIYLDNAAATPIDSRVKREMFNSMELYANPSSFNDAGRLVRKEIEKARQTVANFLNARSSEVVFTGSGSEANNLAITGALVNFKIGCVLTSPIEHKSVLEPLKRSGLQIKLTPVNSFGLIDPRVLARMLSLNCRMVSVMYANNEIGTIEPIQKIAKIILEYNKKNNVKILFHVDACQAASFLNMNVQDLGIDLLTLDGCKIYGPHGVGVLYVRQEIFLKPLIVGADQEHGLRAGTENLQTIVGLAKAVTLIDQKQNYKMSEIRDYALRRLSKVGEIKINGPQGKDRLPNNINISVKNFNSEVLLLELDKYGIYAGSGSACTTHSVESSRVLKAIGVESKYINGTLRFSLGRQTTKKDIDYVLEILPKVVRGLKKRYGK